MLILLGIEPQVCKCIYHIVIFFFGTTMLSGTLGPRSRVPDYNLGKGQQTARYTRTEIQGPTTARYKRAEIRLGWSG